MLEAIRTDVIDPYATLHLDPMASPAVVMAIYGVLAKRARRTGAESLATLQTARDLLMDEDHRRAYDETHGYAGQRAPRNSYETLGIALDADIGILDIAYSVGIRGGDEDRRKLVRLAHRTLANPYLRARYDLSLVEGAEPPPVTRVRTTAPALETVPDASGPTSILARNPAFEQRMTPTAPLQPAVEQTPPPIPEPDASTRSPAHQAASARLDAPENEKADVHEASGAAHEVVSPEDDAPSAGETLAFDDSSPVQDRVAFIPLPPAPREPWGSDASHRDHSARLAAAEANTAREFASAPREETAMLQFVAGPRDGQSVTLKGDTVTIGCGRDADVRLSDAGTDVAASHARIWHLGARYVLRRLDGAEITVDGAVLREPAVTLHDGAVIGVGNHHMKFVCRGGVNPLARTARP